MPESGARDGHSRIATRRPRGTEWRLGHRPALDGLRGAAIILVIGNHIGVPGFTNAGQVGVTIFFVLSGFLITSILLEERDATGTVGLVRFYWHRALRLLPALGAMILVAIPLLAWTVAGAGPASVVPTLLYVANWEQVAAARDMPVVGHAWSLSVEEQFYAVWPLLVLGLCWAVRDRRWFAAILGTGAGFIMVERWILWQPTKEGFYRVFYGSDTRADALLIGAALAAGFSLAPRVPPRWLALGAVATIAIVVTMPSIGFLATMGTAVAAIAACALVAAATKPIPILVSRPLVFIGLLSYALYLWHVPTLYIARTLLGDGIAASLLGVVLAFLAATASRRWIELPAKRWRRLMSDPPVRSSRPMIRA